MQDSSMRPKFGLSKAATAPQTPAEKNTPSDIKDSRTPTSPHHVLSLPIDAEADKSTTMALKLIAFASLIEYVFIKPYIISPASDGDGTDFVGYCLAMAVLAFFGKMHIQDLSPAQIQTTLWSGLFGGLVGYAWLLFYIPKETRFIHHLLVANVAILAGVLFGAWDQRRRRKGGSSGGRRV